jgi:hypothetical protein
MLNQASYSHLVANPLLNSPMSSQSFSAHIQPWRNLKNNALSSLHELFGSVTIHAKTTVHCYPGSPCIQPTLCSFLRPANYAHCPLPSINALQTHCTEKSKQISQEMKLRPRFQFCSKIGGPIAGIYKFLTWIWTFGTSAAQFHFWEYINRILFVVWETYIQQRTQLQMRLFF